MPELPEVEFARGCVERWLGGQVLAKVEADRTRIIRESSKSAIEKLARHRLESVARRGKWLVWRFDGGVGLLAHLGMTGKFVLQRPGEPTAAHSRVRLFREDGATLHYRDPRMFGQMIAGPIVELMKNVTYRSLGPDAWDDAPTASRLGIAFQSSTRAVKDLLMDQTRFAGIGNIYATEALFRSGIHPARPGPTLARQECAKLARAVRWALGRALKMNSGDLISYVEEAESDNPFVIYGRAGTPCPKCGTILREMTIAGRTSVFCAKCQPLR